MKTLTHKTNEKTINKKVKQFIVNNLLLAGQVITQVKKKYVPECGYVYYFKNQFGVTLVNASSEDGRITLRYNR